MLTILYYYSVYTIVYIYIYSIYYIFRSIYWVTVILLLLWDTVYTVYTQEYILSNGNITITTELMFAKHLH